MRRVILIGLALGLMAAFVVGCGDDDETPTTSTKDTGDLSDPTYVVVEGAFTESEAVADELWAWLEGLMDTVFTDSANLASGKYPPAVAAADSVSLAYHANTQYWYLYIRHIDTTFGQQQAVQEIVTFVLHDSVQFVHGTAAVQWPDSSLLTRINNGVLLTVNTMTGVGSMTAAQNVNVVGAPGEIVDRGDVVLNGTRSYDFNVTDQANNCSIDIDITGTANDVGMNLTVIDAGGCPNSGVLTHNGTIAIECTGDNTVSFSDTWVITQTFHADSYDIVVENSTTRWATTETCPTTGGVTSSIAKLLADFRRNR
ncbi:MAG: hypothetical protein JSW34_09135 [Candidatus Zixiibacteriota bacterium]|nr:MAG: hypothetical protein JSW34_09135 [candidate division Zixibacteria bacterium]